MIDANAGPIAIAGPALLFGGNYSNLEATRAVLEEARRLKIPSDSVVCTGNIIAYCADPLATVEVMRRSRAHVVMGSCEELLGSDSATAEHLFATSSHTDPLAAEWISFASRMLDDGSRTWMRSLPRRLDLEIGGRRLAVVHGGSTDIHRLLFATSREALRVELGLVRCDGVIGGHCGLPFTEIIDGQIWHNPGAIGLPANDGTPRCWYSTVRPEGGRLRFEHHPLEYDFAVAAQKMRQAGMSERYALALQDGLWPSCEVLPPNERAQRGKPIESKCVEW